MKPKQVKDDFQSEDELIEFIQKSVTSSSEVLGIGDDAAMINVGSESLVLTTDSLVEDVHFKREWVTSLYLGKKAARSNLSDVAAMGAKPLYALVSLVLPKSFYKKSIISSLYKGFLWAFAPHNVSIIGGNISSGNHIVISLTLIGKASNKPLLRSGAKPDDLIYCTGELGKAAKEVSALYQKKKRSMAFISPDRIALARVLSKQSIASSCIDVSDGLIMDLHRLMNASHVGAKIFENRLLAQRKSNFNDKELKFILHGGEDYELLFTAPSSCKYQIEKLSRDHGVRITNIGIIEGYHKNLEIEYGSGEVKTMENMGWDHVNKNNV